MRVKKEWFLLFGVVTVTLVSAIGLVRWFAPRLLGVPADLQMVRVSKEVPPFYENVFRREDYQSREFQLKDPYTNVRAKPLLFDPSGSLGPHDILGFRNLQVPSVADVVIIGDSQTYGNNAAYGETWPGHFTRLLAHKRPIIYSMATGGWGAVQYLSIFGPANAFRPRVIVVAFYSGNDPLESFLMAYTVDRWAALRPNPNLSSSDVPPSSEFPPPESRLWRAQFADGTNMTFSPAHRLASNHRDYPAVHAGYAIMREVAREMTVAAVPHGVRLVFTVIPTKELVYAERVRRDGLKPTDDYLKLVSMERKNIEELAATIRELPGADYVDLLAPLQKAALEEKKRLYPEDLNGHPLASGYREIAQAIAPVVDKHLPPPVRGLVAVRESEQVSYLYLVRGDGIWGFASLELARANGWGLNGIRVVRPRDIEGLPFRGTIDAVDPALFGPASVR